MTAKERRPPKGAIVFPNAENVEINFILIFKLFFLKKS